MQAAAAGGGSGGGATSSRMLPDVAAFPLTSHGRHTRVTVTSKASDACIRPVAVSDGAARRTAQGAWSPLTPWPPAAS